MPRFEQQGAEEGRGTGLVAKTVAAVVTIFLLSGCIVSVFTSSHRHPEVVEAAIAQPEYPLNFLVVGDWGREGAYNQTLVAKQVRTPTLQCRSTRLVI